MKRIRAYVASFLVVCLAIVGVDVNFNESRASLKAVAGFNQAAVAITGGTISGVTISSSTHSSPTFTGTVTGARATLFSSAIPLINISTGSIAANGALSAITALPRAYANAYCYFPANAVATVAAAGWYYCTFSTTTAGTVFLNTYDPSTGIAPTIPSSPTAVSDGKGAYTGVTSEIEHYQTVLAANTLGVNGAFYQWQDFETNNNANAKNHRTRISGSGGTQVANFLLTSMTGLRGETVTMNRGATNVQVTSGLGVTDAAAGAVTASHTVSAIDTTAAVTISNTTQKATATDNIVHSFIRIEYAR